MAENNKIKQPNLSFATLDAGDDLDADKITGGEDHGVKGILHHNSGINIDATGYQTFIAPINLALLWILIFIFENVFGGTQAASLEKFPVVVGGISHIGIMSGITNWVGSVLMMHKILGSLLFIIDRVILLAVMFVVSFTTAFFHATIGHLFGNIIFLAIVAGISYVLHYPLIKLLKNWLIISGLSIFATWIVVSIVSFLMQRGRDTMSWVYQVVHSTTPIVGASVGLCGLLGFLLVQAWRERKDSRWNQLFIMLLIVMAFAIVYSQFHSLSSYKMWTSMGAAMALAAWMHLVGTIFGVVRGVQDPTLMKY